MPGGAFMHLWAIELTAHFLALLATYMNRDNQLVNGAILNMKTIIILPPTFPSERQPIRVKTPIRTFTGPWLTGKVLWFWPGSCLLITDSAWVWFLTCCETSPPASAHLQGTFTVICVNFFPFLGNFLDLFFLGGIYFFVTNASKSLSFQP